MFEHFTKENPMSQDADPRYSIRDSLAEVRFNPDSDGEEEDEDDARSS